MRKRLRLARLFSETGSKLGLTYQGLKLRGRIDDLDVLVELTGGGFEPRPFTSDDVRVKVWAPRFPPPEVLKLVRGRLGFDEPASSVSGPIGAIAEGLSQVSEGLPRDCADLTARAERVIAAVRTTLAAPIPALLFENLAPNVRTETRLESLCALVEHYRKTEEAARALNASLADANPELRYLAALESTDSALEAFVLDSAVPSDLRWSALLRLETRVPYERLSPVLGKLLHLQDEPCRIRALSHIASHKDRAHAEKVSALATQARADLSEAVAQEIWI